MRSGGDRDAADRVKKLRRPTAAAWLINRAALTAPAEVEEFVESSRRLEEAQRRALEGEDADAAGWRAAADRDREATAALAEVARGGARDAGRSVSERALELVTETLRAATADPELRDRVLNGRVEREQSAATLGTLGLATPAAPRRGRARRKHGEVGTARRELKRLERQLADAAAREERQRGKVERATEALRGEKERLAASKRETTELRRRVKAAERRARDQ